MFLFLFLLLLSSSTHASSRFILVAPNSVSLLLSHFSCDFCTAFLAGPFFGHNLIGSYINCSLPSNRFFSIIIIISIFVAWLPYPAAGINTNLFVGDSFDCAIAHYPLDRHLWISSAFLLFLLQFASSRGKGSPGTATHVGLHFVRPKQQRSSRVSVRTLSPLLPSLNYPFTPRLASACLLLLGFRSFTTAPLAIWSHLPTKPVF